MASSTTFGAIRNKVITVVEALTPSVMNRPEDRFRRCPDKRQMLEAWAAEHASDNCFRKFDYRVSGSLTDPEILDFQVILRKHLSLLTMSYPVAPALYGPNDLDSMEDVIASDAAQLRDAIFDPNNLVGAGHIANVVTIEDVDRGNPAVWFQRFTIEVTYYHAATYGTGGGGGV
jgi:hypothetical protein